MLIILISLILIQTSYSMSVASCSNAISSTDNWTMFRNDPGHSGTTTGNSPTNSAKLLWNFTTMQGVVSSPAVANGYVFVGSNEGAVYCLNSSNGELVWYYPTGSAVASSPAIDNGRVYIGSYDGNVYALNATSGAKLWNSTIGSSVEASPGSVYSSPAVVGGVVYVGSYDGNVYALNATSGAKLWNSTIGSSVESSPAVSDGVVYIASNFFVYALNASTGNEIWNHHTGSTISSPAVYNGYVYIGSYDGYVCGLNASTGTQIWKYQTQDSVDSSPAVAYGCVYVGSEDNNVYCLNASTGSKIWQSPTGYWVWSSPAVAGGNVYVGSEDYSIYCLNASTGAKEWSYETGNFVDSSPAIINNTLYVGSDDNHIYAFALFNSTVETVPLQSTSSLAWTTIAFDVIAGAVMAVIVFAVVLFVRSTRRAKRNAEAANISGRNVSWFSAHTDALCVLAILAFSTIFFINIGNGHLSAADEQTYSQWAFHMVKTGDYLTPWAFGGIFFAGKPPLSIWLMSLAYQVFGVNNFASRFFSAVFGTLSLVLIFYLGKKLYNGYVGFLSALVLGTLTTFYEFARLAMTDVPLVFFVLGSIYFFVLSEKSEKTTRYAALSGLFFGLALMTKQIEALLILLIIFAYLIATRKSIRFLFTKHFTLFWGIGLLVFSPWLIYMNARFGSQFWYWYFVYDDITRTVGTVESHVGSYLYYFSYLANNENLLWVILLPFSAGLCAFNAVIKRLKGDTMILLWMTIVLLVFTLAQTKLFWYILPAFPAFAIAISSFLYQLSKKIFQLSKKIKLSAR
ncbi:MAG: PQQ-binding-like beta-propeller repeat protein [Candidatus Bathyarchaeia archaeon]